MRILDALLRAMRTRQAGRIGLHEADRLAAGGHPGPGHPGLAHLLDAVRAPATTAETRGEREAVAAFAAQHRRAVPAARSAGIPSNRRSRSLRTVVVTLATIVALLAAAGTAVAARTGNLPAGAQQHAHRLFSALGVPAPRTSATPVPAPTPSPSLTPTPSASASASASVAPPQKMAWCAAWQSGRPMDDRSRRALITAAGGKEKIGTYCAGASPSPSMSASAPSSSPAESGSPSPRPSVSRTPE